MMPAARDVGPLSVGQEALWLYSHAHPGDPAYHLGFPFDVAGALDLGRLRDALAALVTRHPLLGARISGGATPELEWSSPAPIPVCEHAVADDLDAAIAALVRRPFDLARGPLARVDVVRGAADTRLLLAVHHIMFDGASLPVLLADLRRAWAGELPGAPDVRAAGFAERQRAMLAGPDGERQRAFWRDYLVGELPELALPSMRDAAAPGYAVHRARLPAHLRDAAIGLARRLGITTTTVLLGVFHVLLRRYGNPDDLVIGVPYQGIRGAELADCIGYLNNLLPVRTRLTGDVTGDAVLRRLADDLARCKAHGAYPYARIVRDLGLGGQPMLRAVFVPWRVDGRDDLDVRALALPGRGGGTLRLLDVVQEEEFPLTLQARFDHREITMLWKTRAGAVAPAHLPAMAEHFENLLAAITAEPERRIADLAMLGAAEHARIVVDWNLPRCGADCELPALVPVHRRFERQVRATPDAEAVRCGDRAMTYAELDRAAGRLAGQLRARGVARDVTVGVCLERSLDLVIALLAVLKAGGAYVPIDPAYPEDRVRLVAEDARLHLVITSEAIARALPDGPARLVIDGCAAWPEGAPASEGAANADDDLDALAWVLYTSGSTGRPKGVAIAHRSASALLETARRAFDAADRAAVLASSSIAFDLGGFELWLPLCCGGTAVIVRHVLDLLAADRPRGTLLSTVPSAMRALLGEGFDFSGLRVALIAGERLPTDLVRALHERVPGMRVYDAYGPTETTTFSTLTLRGPGDPETVGRAVDHTEIHILDGDGQPVPVGVVGEIHIAGLGVARGYHHRPAETAERFVANPVLGARSPRAYRTGDLGRWLPDGRIAFHGRRDHQVKLRGHRIELGEIDAVLREHPRCREAVTVLRGARGGDPTLATFATVEGERSPALAEELRGHLARRLPGYMVPPQVKLVDVLPRTPNGKIDRLALAARGASGAAETPPRSNTERWLATLWSDLLGAPVVDVRDDFFALGGHSLLAARVFTRIGAELEVDLPWRTLFDHPTLADLARAIDDRRAAGAGPAAAIPPAGDGWLPLGHAQRAAWRFEQLYPGTATYHVPCHVDLDGVLDTAALRDALHAVVRRQAALRLVMRRAGAGAEQRALPELVPPLALHDLRALFATERAAVLDRLADELATRPFELEEAPLLRFALVRLADDRHRLFATFHHLIIDGPSLARFHDELWALYGLGEAGQRVLPVLPVQFTDHAAWQDRRAQDGGFAEGCAWWLRVLDDAPPPMFPGGAARGALLRHGVHRRVLAPDAGEVVDALAAAAGATRFTVVLAAVAAVLARAALVDDLVIGAAVSSRRARGLDDLIGFFVNPLPLRVRIAGDPRLVDLIAQLRPVVVDGLAHQDVPLELIAAAPAFQVMLVMLDLPDGERIASGLRVGPPVLRSVSSKFPLTIYVRPRLRGWSLEMEYDADRFAPAQIDGLADALDAVLRRPYQRIAALPPPAPLVAVTTTGGTGAAPGAPSEPDATWCVATPHEGRLAFIERFEAGTVYPGPPTYHNLPCLLTVDTAPDLPARLAGAAARLVERHPALRSNLVWRDDGLRRRTAAPGGHHSAAVAVEWLAEAALPDGDCSAELAAWIERPFRLASDRLFRVAAQALVGGRVQIALVAHRAIADRMSLRMLAEELRAALAGAALGGPVGSEPVPAAISPEDVAYWRWVLRGQLPVLELPEQHRRAAVHVYEADLVRFAVSSTALRAIATAEGAAESDVLLAALLAVLALHTGQRDLVIGMVDPRRGDAGDAIGALDNLLVLRTTALGPTFRALVRDTAALAAAARRHGALPFDTLVDLLAPEKDMSRTALFDVVFEHVATPAPGIVEPGTGHGKYDLHVQLQPGETGYAGRLVFNRRIYDRAAVEQLAEHLVRVLDQAAAAPGIEVDALDPLGADERRRLAAWNDTAANAPGGATIWDRFAEQAAQRPAATALVWEGRRLSYGELRGRAERVACGLAARGVQPGDLVAVQLERSFDLIVAMLGVLRAGAAYVPLEPDAPPERLAFVLGDAAPRLLIGSAAGAPPGFTGPIVAAADLAAAGEPPPGPSPEAAAYCIYTSGTTGRPKGVVISHRNVLRLVCNDRFPFSFGPDDVWTLFHSACFDFSVWELFGALTWGGAVVIVPEAVARDPQRFWGLVQRERVSVLNQTPGAFLELVRASETAPAALPHLRYVIFGGDKLQPALLAGFHARYPDVALVNMYGITETTVHVTVRHLTDDDIAGNVSNIGAPLPTTVVRLIDRHARTGAGGCSGLRLVPIGAVGEIYVGGDGVANGYLRRPELDAERFLPDPFQPGQRLYRSGDLARYRSDGTLEFLGRADAQVKLRGYRIEPAEIEAQLRAHAAIREAVVVLDHRAGGRLVAYVRLADEPPEQDKLRAYLAARLPGYMVPSEIVPVDRIPLTRNGKVDRGALRRRALPGSRPAAPPSTPAAVALRAIWHAVLAVDPACELGDDTSFFEVGGHSLLIAELVMRIEERFGVALALRDVFEHPRLGELAAHIDRSAAPAAAPAADAGALSSFQKRLWFLHQVAPHATTYLVPLAWRIPRALDPAALERAFALLIERHEILRTRIVDDAGRPVARIEPAPGRERGLEIGLEIDDLRGTGSLAGWLDRVTHRTFDPASGRLIRPALAVLDGGEQVLAITMHHLIWDGASLMPLLCELDACYRAAAGGPPPPEPAVQYRHYVQAEHEARARPEHAADLAWWGAALHGAPPLALPVPDQPSEDGAVALPLTAAAVAGLRRVAAEQGATLYMVLAAAVAAVLHRRCDQDDLLIGSPAARRSDRQFATLLGPCVDTIALRSRRIRGDSVAALLAGIRTALLAAHDHPHARFEEVVARINPPRRPGRIPLIDAMVTLDIAPRRAPEIAGVPLIPIDLGVVQAKFDLTFAFDDGDALRGQVIYRGDRIAASEAALLAGQLARMIAELPAALHRSLDELDELDELDPGELAALRGFERGAPADPGAVPVADRVAAIARARPDALAVSAPHGALSYGELERRAAALAAQLTGLPGDPAAPIALVLPRGPELVIAMLAAWRAGRPFCPLDVSYPDARIRFVLSDLGAAAMIAQDAGAARRIAPDVPWLAADAAPSAEAPGTPRSVDPDATAYILYTSGSTGQPKGVAVSHRSLAQLARWHADAFAISAADRASQLASVGFDAMIWEVWPYLAAGACIVPWPGGPLVPDALIDWLAAERITMAFVATPLAEEVWRAPVCVRAPLRWMLIGGDRARSRPPRDLPYRVATNYGPTECTVVATSQPLPATASSPVAAIGRPIAGTRVHVVDGAGRRCAIGATGEIWIAGAGVAQGYWRHPALTAERFVTAAFDGEPVRVYRTGDLARWLADGSLEYIGRTDRQVQVRGRRVEPGEVEAALTAVDRVAHAVVHGRDDDAAPLVAYLVARGPRPDGRAVLAELRHRLPAYLIPDAVVWLDRIPTTAHGKVDHAALPAPTRDDRIGEAPTAPPETELEHRIAAVWRRVLGVARIGIDDSFFDLGGSSLLLVRLHRELQRDAAPALTIAELFQHPTVRQLARALARPAAPGDGDADLVDRARRRRDAQLRGRPRAALGESHD